MPGLLSVKCLLISAQVTISWFCGFEPRSGHWAVADSVEPAWNSLSPALCPSLSCSLSKTNLKKAMAVRIWGKKKCKRFLFSKGCSLFYLSWNTKNDIQRDKEAKRPPRPPSPAAATLARPSANA